ncbi:MAG TPA: TIGR04283 family arsenosugar biosynthesis glycosyltransferase [Sphingomicrobium sp.]|nr:TIGR04283 family arsenosugar biosynthesis glycosyltransferase [Sphingomicrobium sp.]
MKRLSVVIPTLNAADGLARCLAAISQAGEVIVVDGGSRDDSLAIAKQAGARCIVAPANRGGQMHAGAMAAAGEWLLFLHADTVLGAGWHEAVAAHIEGHAEDAACFAFRLDDRAWQARVIEASVAVRVRALGLPYGDQGLLIARDLYERAGGFRALALMEDVELVRRIGRVRVLRVAALTSAERWRRDGWFRRSAKNFACLMAYFLGASPERIARIYR